MAWPKYAEDNQEIMISRLDAKEPSKIGGYTSAYCDLGIPATSRRNEPEISFSAYKVSIGAPRKATGFRNKTLVCSICGSPFLYSAEQQRSHERKGLGQPKWCDACRRQKRVEAQIQRDLYWQNRR